MQERTAMNTPHHDDPAAASGGMQIDRLRLHRHADRTQLGAAAGRDAAAVLRSLLASQPAVRAVFAAAPSQNEMLAELRAAPGIDWSRVIAFHMDEYIGLDPAAPQRFGRFLTERLFAVVRPGQVHLIDGLADPATECQRYAAFLTREPIDLVCLGIGENGHLAFNDPPVADFADPHPVKVVALDESCRRQQVNDGCFATFADVPTHALTLTIPTLCSGRHLVCSVPGALKRAAVTETLTGPIRSDCPATILRTHPDCVLHVDRDSLADETLQALAAARADQRGAR
jgi:glucosamine-6-phosphate deaminase